MRILTLAAALAATCAVLRADFSYQESTQITGGTMLTVLKLGGPFTRGARAAQISSVAVKGNRMMRSDKDSVSIIDLDKETITDIDLEKKQYSVTTFAQIRAAMEKAMADLRKREKTPSDAALKFKVSAKSTGRTQEIRGLNAKELLIGMEMQASDTKSGQTGAFNVAEEAWMASVSGYDQVKAFELKLGEKLAAAFRPGMEQMALTQPAMVQGMAEAAKELAKADGVPIQSIVRMGSGSPEQLQAAGQRNAEARENNKGKSAAATAGAIAGALTGFGGFGRRKNKEEDTQAKSDENKQAPGATILMEMTTNLSDFSTVPVEEAKFQIPAGFKQVESEIAKRAK